MCASCRLTPAPLPLRVAPRPPQVLRHKCFTGIAWQLLNRTDTVMGATQRAAIMANSDYSALYALCECLSSDYASEADFPYCDFYQSRLQFFWAGMALVYCNELSCRPDAWEWLRPLTMGGSIMYMAVMGITFFPNTGVVDSCNSEEYDQKGRLVGWASFASAMLLFPLCAYDIHKWRVVKIRKQHFSSTARRRAVGNKVAPGRAVAADPAQSSASIVVAPAPTPAGGAGAGAAGGGISAPLENPTIGAGTVQATPVKQPQNAGLWDIN